MLKKIVCLALCMIFSVSITSFAQSADNKILHESDEYRELFEAMEVLPASFELDDNPVTRADFVTFLISLMDFSLTADTKSSFADVSEGSELASALKIAVSLGVVSDSDKFCPSDIITYPQAIKMTVAALGYNAESNYRGGYPVGYYAVAQRLGMDVAYDGEEMNVSDALYLLGQMCETRVNDVSGVYVSDEATDLVMSQGDSFLYHYRKIYAVSGVVEATDISYLDDSTDSLSPRYVRIDKRDFVLSDGVECELGYFASAFVQEDNTGTHEVIYASVTQNEMTLITEENNPVMSANGLEYTTEDGKVKRLKCAEYYSVLYNGKSFENCTNDDFSIKEGRIEAIDNNLDGDVDVFSIRVPRYLVTDYADPFDEIVYDENYGGNLVLNNSDIIYTSDTPIKNIKSGDCLEVFESKDGRYAEISLLKTKVTGKIEGYSSDGKLIIDGSEYGVSDYFKLHYAKIITLGSEFTVAIGKDGKCVAVKAYENNMLYGYLDAFSQNGGIDSAYVARIFSQNGEVEVLTFADKLRIDGSVKNQEDAYSLLADKCGEVIRYKKDSAGKLKIVNTSGDNHGFYLPAEDGVNAIKRYNFTNYDTSVNITYKITGYFVPYFIIDNATSIFCIAEGESKEEYRFSMGNGVGFLPNDSKVPANTVWAYNVDESGRADVLLYKTDSYSAAIDEESVSALVSDFNAALDDEGNNCYKMELYANDSFVTYYIDAASKLVAEGADSYAVGDFIRYTVNSAGYITNIRKDFDNKTQTILGSTSENTKNHYYYGDIYMIGDNSVALMRDGGDIIYLPIVLGDIGFVSQNGVSTMPKNVIKTFKHMDKACSKALVKCYYSSPQAVYIYE